ncbi:hypothetical protein R6Q59_020887 [Mikania micrantha]|uniref:RING-type E3 ubiquitin transferase n=1 Tax=Mikania micrantha TaxID=192012 RepID=A0A5N6PMU7_9ASTR|nr:hypothetical protein E3N88_06120 [Mikania micrantha]KAD7476866.1 hypothetical protein E3N88_00002 [Mikania micrantha]
MSPPPPSPPHKPNSPMLYYTIVVVATATIVLAIYHLIIVRLCTIQYHRHRRLQQQALETPNSTVSPPSPSIPRGGDTACLISSFKYTKGSDKNPSDCGIECSVCLSVFEEGEEVKRLPVCGHSFHALCIDMWLYSHAHCPLCRAPVVEPPPPPPGSSSV